MSKTKRDGAMVATKCEQEVICCLTFAVILGVA